MTITMSDAVASAAAFIQMQNDMLRVRAEARATEEHPDGVEEPDEAESDDDVPADAKLYLGEMSEEDVAKLTRRQHIKYTAAMSESVSVCGGGAYTFHSPNAVRCNLCANANPKYATSCH